MVLPLTAGILENNPHINEVIQYDSSVIEGSFRKTLSFIRDLRMAKFDWSFDFSPNFRNIAYTCLAWIPNRICIRTPYCSRMTKSLYWMQTGICDYDSRSSAMRAYLESLEFIGISDYSMKKEVYVQPGDTPFVERFLAIHNIQPEDTVIALHPFAGVRMKEWGSDKFIQLAEQIVHHYKAKIVLIGALSDRENAEKMREKTTHGLVNSCGEFSLSQLPALLSRCQVFISVDTGPLYIANALGVPVVNIAGPCDLHTQSPDGIHEIIQKSLECAPCSFIMDAPRICKRGDRKCLKLVSVDEVLEALERLLAFPGCSSHQIDGNFDQDIRVHTAYKSVH
jgi:ADP-heptose:LPS heptosyltransferase